MAHCIFDLSNVVKTRKTTDRYHLSISRFQVQQGDTLAIVGRSGCGKSTALDLLACALRPDPPHEKSAFFFSPSPDRKIDLYAAWDRDGINATAEERMRHLGYILQTGGLLPFLTARDNILLVSKILNIMPARITAIREITEELNISPLLSKYPAQLSVGERQRVAIAKALAHNPTAVLADEPTAALDPNHSKLVMKLFLGLARRQGSTIIMVSHDQALAAELGFTLVPMNVTASSEGVSASLYFASNMGSS